MPLEFSDAVKSDSDLAFLQRQLEKTKRWQGAVASGSWSVTPCHVKLQNSGAAEQKAVLKRPCEGPLGLAQLPCPCFALRKPLSRTAPGPAGVSPYFRAELGQILSPWGSTQESVLRFP